ncbi:mechanosensitive ion channel family protein [Phaeodactylibacter sp.]|uniref:mechanosensitive ion channel family protein n=1 Tax=Phaeodactylibacter sp. TaxID=1940289 RepID=UPI0025D6F709|nr:mechanosensitive ion channel family protein [Phaeodactylibacter sp.]MCI4648635.1 mechanosensitive ion channel family protein [Phaeodactylibacter sp.]MCI5091216.1 mechanosensitive ion channel family protein [Phaeodactylibacter sp.]
MKILKKLLFTLALLPGTSLAGSAQIPVDSTQAKTNYQKARPQIKGYNSAFYLLNDLNPGLPERPPGVNLQTPRACLEHFVRACRKGAFHEAAHALNFNLMPAAQQQEVAEARARELFYILSKSVRIDWDLLSDRPDGQINQGITAQQSITGQPLRSINFGSLDLNGQTLPLRIQRVRVEEQSPVWVVSANTVENIIPLYKAYGPSPLAQRIPVWAKTEIIGIAWWKIIGLVVLITLCLLIARLSQYLINKAVKRSEQPWVNELGEKMGQPVALAISALLFYAGMKQVLSISGTWSPYLYALLLIIVIGSVTWLLMRSIDYLMDRVAERKVGDITNEENLESKRYLTLISVVRKVITFLIIILGIGAVVSQFPSLQNLGLSLFASAGIATVILGIAAQSTLGNIIAGLQIAITKPVRIGDWVLFEGEYGAVEDIRFTYLVINTWDKRRVVVPLRYFITHPFENWTMYDAHLLKPIVLHADYEIDVNLVRNKFAELLRAADAYDETLPPKVQVVDSSKESIVIRALCSARNAPIAWDLHCQLREDMVAYIARLEAGKYLAKERVKLQH